MNKKSKIILISLIAIFGVGILFIPFLPARATTNFQVNFENDPLFKEANFMPGSSITRWVEIVNNSGEKKPIAAEAINWAGFPDSSNIPSDDLSRALLIVIRKHGGPDLYGGASPTGEKTLFNFYEDGETYLSDVANGSTVKYDFIVSFPKEKTSEWQGKTTGFDIIVGVQGEGTPAYACNDGIDNDGDGKIDYPNDPGCTSYNDNSEEDNGGGSQPGGHHRGLIISGEGTSCVSDVDAIITWTTSYKSTSRVVYGTSSGLFNFNSFPNYGYPSSTVEQDNVAPIKDNGVINHSVDLTGLAPNTTYYFRCISHASPPTVGTEHSFTTLSPGEKSSCCGENKAVTTSSGAAGNEISFQGHPAAPKTSNEQAGSGSTTTNAEEPLAKEENKGNNFNFNNLLASIGNLFNLKSPCVLIFIFAIILAILSILSLRKKYEEEKRRKKHLIYQIIVNILIIVLLILQYLFCPYWWVLLIIVAAIFFFYFIFKKKK